MPAGVRRGAAGVTAPPVVADAASEAAEEAARRFVEGLLRDFGEYRAQSAEEREARHFAVYARMAEGGFAPRQRDLIAETEEGRRAVREAMPECFAALCAAAGPPYSPDAVMRRVLTGEGEVERPAPAVDEALARRVDLRLFAEQVADRILVRRSAARRSAIVALADAADPRTLRFARSRPDLAKDAGASWKTVMEVTRDLERRGVIQLLARGGNAGPNTPNEYVFLVPGVSAPAREGLPETARWWRPEGAEPAPGGADRGPESAGRSDVAEAVRRAAPVPLAEREEWRALLADGAAREPRFAALLAAFDRMVETHRERLRTVVELVERYDAEETEALRRLTEAYASTEPSRPAKRDGSGGPDTRRPANTDAFGTDTEASDIARQPKDAAALPSVGAPGTSTSGLDAEASQDLPEVEDFGPLADAKAGPGPNRRRAPDRGIEEEVERSSSSVSGRDGDDDEHGDAWRNKPASAWKPTDDMTREQRYQRPLLPAFLWVVTNGREGREDADLAAMYRPGKVPSTQGDMCAEWVRFCESNMVKWTKASCEEEERARAFPSLRSRWTGEEKHWAEATRDWMREAGAPEDEVDSFVANAIATGGGAIFRESRSRAEMEKRLAALYRSDSWRGRLDRDAG